MKSSFSSHRAAGHLPVMAGVALISLLAACSSTKPPTAEMATARTLVEQAGQSDARNQSPVELNAAQDKLKRAEAAMKDERYKEAKALAEEAEVDAQLAAARSRSGRAATALSEVQSSIGGLKSQIEQKGR